MYPLVVNTNGVKIKSEQMEQEKLYHCIFKAKIILVYKDKQKILHCYEIEEKDLVDKVRQCGNKDNIEKIFNDYIIKQNMNN